MKPIIPEACLKQSIAIIGRTGSGKTYSAKGLVERILADQARVCIVDPLGVWWGLRSSADGKAPAFPVIVFGGDHADVPLTEGMGAALAETLASQNLPAIVDVSEFTAAGRTRFITSFLEELYARNRTPITLVVDEADMFAPQRPGKEQLTMLGRMEQICRRGRVRGFRPWLITQRPASLHKSVLSQANTLIAMQLTAPQDRDALGDWIEGQASREDGKRVLAELPKLGKGEGFVWAPHEELLERVKFPRITTYDSSRTPEEGEQLPQIQLAKVDLSRIGEQLRALEDRDLEEADELEEARARIAELEEELRVATENAVLDTPVLDEATIAAAELNGYKRGRAEAIEAMFSLRDAVASAAEGLVHQLRESITARIEDLSGDQMATERSPVCMSIERQMTDNRAPDISRDSPHKPGKTPDKSGSSRSALPAGEEKILTAIAQHRGGVTREGLTVITGYKRSTRDTYIQRLRERGLVEDGGPGIVATPAGVKALGTDFKPLPKGAALRRYWLDRLPEGERKVLEVVLSTWPRDVDRDAISKATDYKRSTRDTYVQRLASRQLVIPNARGTVRASPNLFE